MFDTRLHDRWDPPVTDRSRSLIEAIASTARQENRAAARKLKSIGDLFELRRRQRGEEADWAVDTWAAVGAELAAALRINLGKAGSCMSAGLAMRGLPRIAAVFSRGDIDIQMFQTAVYRTALITDDAIRAEVDRTVADIVARWPSMTRGRLAREIDRVVNAADPDAVRRAKERARDRDITFFDAGDGTADVSGRLFSADAHLLDKRLDALAATVCEADPRTAEQRRADALGALAAGAERLMCRCGGPNCPAASAIPSPVVIHVVAEQETVEGRGAKPGYLLGADSLITADLLRDLAAGAKLSPLESAGAAAEPRYRPSQALSDFVRARDLTCRAPGCDRPATDCDLDHTVPYSSGGRTHASNIKCLCRFHHLVKTFWGWKDRQLIDGTVVWTLPDGQVHVTAPGSTLLFPALTAPTTEPGTGDRAAMMPRRSMSRARSRSGRIAAERAHNRRLRAPGPLPPAPVDKDPPF